MYSDLAIGNKQYHNDQTSLLFLSIFIFKTFIYSQCQVNLYIYVYIIIDFCEFPKKKKVLLNTATIYNMTLWNVQCKTKINIMFWIILFCLVHIPGNLYHTHFFKKAKLGFGHLCLWENSHDASNNLYWCVYKISRYFLQ